MSIPQIHDSKKVVLSFEVFPPKKDSAIASVKETVRELASLRPDFMSVTYGAGGGAHAHTVELASHVASLGVASLAHLTCVGNTPDSVRATAAELRSRGVGDVLALRGDFPPDGSVTSLAPGLAHASDLVRILKNEGFSVGGACYPEGHPESANRIEDIDNLRHKVDAGVDYLITQLFFENDILYSYLYRLQSQGIRVPVHAGIMPITNSSQVSRMVKLSNAFVPPRLLSICDRFADKPDAMRQAGIAYATNQIIDLLSNGVSAIHLYTMNNPSVARDIIRNVDAIIAAANE